MRKEDLKNWTREQMKGEILRLHRKLELFGIKFEENPNNFSFSHHGNRYYAGKLVNDYVTLKEENSLIKSEYNDAINSFTSVSIDNENLRRRIAKLESDICGTSPCIVSEFHLFEGESWIKASTYDDVLLRLKNANKRITDLEQDMFNKSTDELKQVEKLSSENKSLKQQNDYLKNIFETAYIPESAESMMRKAGFSDEVIDDAKGRIEKLEKELKAENKSLKQRIKDLEDIGNNYEPQFAPDDDISAFNYECVKRWTTEMGCKRKIQELQDQHQQDCIRYNDMRTAYLVTLDELARLREQFGVGK